MKILQAPINVAGQASLISAGLKKLGVKSEVLTFNQNRFAFPSDINLDLKSKPWLVAVFVLFVNFIKCLFKYEYFHFHFGESLLPFNLDLPVMKLFKKKMVMEFWGSDVIQLDKAIHYTLFSLKELREIFPRINDQKKRKRLAKIGRYIKTTIVGDYSLLPFLPKSIVVRQAFDINKLPYVGAKSTGKQIMIVHAPTDRKIKGTKYVLETIKRLKREGYKVNFWLIEKMSNRDAIEAYKRADIAVDDLLQGPYGIFAIECMALGKPVLCRRDEKLEKYYQDLPIINTSPKNIYQNLKYLIEHPRIRQRLGKEGRMYVEKNHNAKNIAQKLLKVYKSL